MPTATTHLRSYRCQLIPPGLAYDEVEQAADARALPELRLRAPSASYAQASAYHLTGRPVARTERLDGGELVA